MSSSSAHEAVEWPDTGQFTGAERGRVEAFVHDVAHDLRSPVRRMRTFAQLVEQRLGDDELDLDDIREFLDRIVACSAELDERVSSMVDRQFSAP